MHILPSFLSVHLYAYGISETTRVDLFNLMGMLASLVKLRQAAITNTIHKEQNESMCTSCALKVYQDKTFAFLFACFMLVFCLAYSSALEMEV